MRDKQNQKIALQCFKRAFLLRIRYTFKLKNGEKITKKMPKKEGRKTFQCKFVF